MKSIIFPFPESALKDFEEKGLQFYVRNPDPKTMEIQNINIKIIPHKNHRYTTVGDWFFDDKTGDLEIRVSKLSDWRRQLLIAVHELCEVAICTHEGISTEVVDKFDKDFEANRSPENEDEPGDEPTAPYVKQHCIATGIERILAAALDVQWKTYEEELGELPEVENK